jgi:tRNA(Ile2) C34 agmatinyltransferase TiaS
MKMSRSKRQLGAERNAVETQYPINSPALRRAAARNEICPECGGCLDTGWECNDCKYDARDEAYPPEQRQRDMALKARGLL